MDDALIEVVFRGVDAEYVAGLFDGRNAESPEPSTNRHPAYRHSWEVGRAELLGAPIPVAWSLGRIAHIEAGGEFYPWFKENTDD